MKSFSFIRHTVVRLLICAAAPVDGGGGGGGPVRNPYQKDNNSDTTAAATAAAATATATTTTNNDGNDNNNSRRSEDPRSAALSRDMSRSESTKKVDGSAIDLLNYYLVYVLRLDCIDDIDLDMISDDMESFLTGYSNYLCHTNIPANHKKFIEQPDLVPTQFLKYTGLREYLSKAFLLLEKLCPDDEFWNDDVGIKNISGEKFKKACQRSQAKKTDSFGQESKVGLYRKARYGRVVDPLYPPHWTFFVNCDEICKQMLLKTFANDIDSRMTEKRLQLTFTKHGVGRGGEGRYLDWNNCWYNPGFDCLDGLWQEMKTLTQYMLSFVPNKDGYPTDILHSLGSFFVVGKGLYRPPSDDGKMSTKVIPYLSEGMNEGGVSRFLTKAVRNNLHPNVPKEQQASISAVSLRIAGVTEMAAGNVGASASHARSGHFLSNQKHYQDDNDPFTSMPAAKCLAGWTNYYAEVHMPNLSCLGVPEAVINSLIDRLVAISLPDFFPGGRLRPILLASIASLLMYDQDVIRDLGTVDNAISLALRQAFKDTNTVDYRAESVDPIATLKYWGQVIRKDFHDSNPDFQSLTDSSNSTQVVNAINHIGTSVSCIQQENRELKAMLTSMSASMEGERAESRLERRDNAGLRRDVSFLAGEVSSCMKQVSKLVAMFNPQMFPPSPPRGSPPSPTSHKRKSPPDSNVAQSASSVATAPLDTAVSSTAASSTAASSTAASSTSSTAPSYVAVSSTAASSTAASSAATNDVDATVTEVADNNASRKHRKMEENYNGVDADEKQGGLSLASIIVAGYDNGYFQHGVSFTPERMRKPFRFSDAAKYNHCMDLFEAVVSEEQRLQLIKPSLPLLDLNDVAHEISEACIERLCQLEGKRRRASMRPGYTGVGLRVQKIKTAGLYPNLRFQLPAGQQRLSFA